LVLWLLILCSQHIIIYHYCNSNFTIFVLNSFLLLKFNTPVLWPCIRLPWSIFLWSFIFLPIISSTPLSIQMSRFVPRWFRCHRLFFLLLTSLNQTTRKSYFSRRREIHVFTPDVINSTSWRSNSNSFIAAHVRNAHISTSITRFSYLITTIQSRAWIEHPIDIDRHYR